MKVTEVLETVPLDEADLSWLQDDGPCCGAYRRPKGRVTCELPPDHQTELVGGVLYRWHLGRDKLGRWHHW